MQYYHLIEVRYLPPTTNLGARIKLVSNLFNQSVTLDYDYMYHEGLDQAEEFLKRGGHQILGKGQVNDRDVIIVDTNDASEFKPLKEK